jgi:hypothetical protein
LCLDGFVHLTIGRQRDVAKGAAMPSMEDIEIQKSDLMLATTHYEVKPGIIKLVATKTI